MNVKKEYRGDCPRCGGPITGFPALSRRDNKTNICNECGVIEALIDAGYMRPDDVETAFIKRIERRKKI
jgi:hypothetical protein